MTTPTEEIERKVRQHDSDLTAIYEMLADLGTGMRKVQGAQLRQGSRLDQIEDRLTTVDERLTGVDGKLDAILELLRRDRSTDGQ